MQDRKEYIMDKAFEVFMAKGYDSVSMTVLQKELKMSRGAMYRYFESKDDLFKAVIDKYFMGLIDRFNYSIPKDTSLLEMIKLNTQNRIRISKFLDQYKNLDVKFLNYTALIIQAAKRYPGFVERMKLFEKENLKNWKTAIQNSIEKGEVKENVEVDILTRLFSKSSTSSDNSGNNGFIKGAKETEAAMMYIYSLIKT